MYVDHHIGRLLDKLRSVGRFEDAVIVIVADHGEGFGRNGVLGPGAWLYESLVRIPRSPRAPEDAGYLERVPGVYWRFARC